MLFQDEETDFRHAGMHCIFPTTEQNNIWNTSKSSAQHFYQPFNDGNSVHWRIIQKCSKIRGFGLIEQNKG